MLFIVVPIANYIRMLLAIQHHNRQLGDAIASQQISAVLQREKKVALDMWIVAIVLLASMTPALSARSIQIQYPQVYSLLFSWFFTMVFFTSSINPLIYFGRNINLRNAVKSMMDILLLYKLECFIEISTTEKNRIWYT